MRALLMCVVLVAAGCGKPVPTTGRVDEPKPGEKGKQQEVGRKAMPRERFRKLLIGKTPDEVIKAVGKPDRTQDISGLNAWYYDRATVDPVTDKTDRTAQVVFEYGVAARVNY